MTCQTIIKLPKNCEYDQAAVQNAITKILVDKSLCQLLWIKDRCSMDWNALIEAGYYLDYRVIGQAESLLGALSDSFPGLTAKIRGKYDAYPADKMDCWNNNAGGVFEVVLHDGKVTTEKWPLFSTFPPERYLRRELVIAGKENLKYAVNLCRTSHIELEKTYKAVLDFIKSDDTHGNKELLQHDLETINKCMEIMAAVTEKLSEIDTIKRSNTLHIQKDEHSEDMTNPADKGTELDNQHTQNTLEQCQKAHESLLSTYERLLSSLGSALHKSDSERLYRVVKAIESCKDDLSAVCSSLKEKNA